MLATLTELLALAVIAVAVAVLASWPWGLLVAGIGLLVVGVALDAARTASPARPVQQETPP